MNHTFSILKRELAGYFMTPVAYVFIVIFLIVAGVFTFYIGGFYEARQADLSSFFGWHPWLYLFLVPALSMRLWAEERKSGTIELLMTLPVTLPQAVLGKFLAAWIFTGISLALTFPIWLTVGYLGDPDNGAIMAGYLGSFLMAGGFLAVGACMSAITKNQVIAFVLGLMVCLFFVLIGFPPILKFFEGWTPSILIEAFGSLSFHQHFESIAKGVLSTPDLVFFASVMVFFLFANTLILDLKKAD